MRSLIVIVLLLAFSNPLRSETITVSAWNDVFGQAIAAETSAPCVASRNLALFHIAIHDSISSLKRQFAPYLQHPAPPEASPEAAALGAAHWTASRLYPSRKGSFDALFERHSASIPASDAKTAGIAWGHSVAERILDSRLADGSSTTETYEPRTEPGQWRRTPPAFRPPELTRWARVTPFAMTNAAQFRPPGPPPLESPAYAAAFREIHKIGGKGSTVRTEEQSLIAQFWADFSYTSTPAGHWNQIARDFLAQKPIPLDQEGRLFALLNIAMADAAIAAWDAKYHYNFWRPVTAIARADEDNNPATEPDPKWATFLPSPPHPDYISGHSTFSSAAAAVLTAVLGSDEFSFTARSETLPKVTRPFARFSDAAAEISKSRVYAGIHFSFACDDGLTVGTALGRFVAKSQLPQVK